MARLTSNIIVLLVLVGIGAAAWHFGRDYVRRHPQDFPWTPLRLGDPIGTFTLRKLAALTDDPAQCRAVLREGAAQHRSVPPFRASADCGFADGMTIIPAPNEATFAPAGVVTSCPVVAAMTLLERQVLQRAAERHLGSRVAIIHHAGSYSCRRINGRPDGAYSEHATADAIDVTGFTLADGRRVDVLSDWSARGPEAAFLIAVRDGACKLFATVLSPDYNQAHADHLHFDQARRGQFGAGLCS